MKIIPYQFTIEDPKVTTYKLNFDNNNIMLDCGSTMFRKEDFADVKYFFISHAHLDHWIGLYQNFDAVINDSIIFTTTTTKKLINVIVDDLLNGETIKTNSEKRQIRNMFANIKEVYFEQPFELGNLTFTLYPAGHMFGASMLYIEGKNNTFLYTGDMDYVEGNKERSYYFDSSKRIDYLLIDGTKLYADTFKKEGLSQIEKDIRLSKRKEYNLRVKDKTKAVYYARALAEELKDHKIIYGGDLTNVNTILYEQGYDIYQKDRILSVKMNKSKYAKTVKITTRENPNGGMKYGEFKLGLHISSDDIIEFIYQYAQEAKIFIGHFDIIYYKKLTELYPNYDFLVNRKKLDTNEVTQG